MEFVLEEFHRNTPDEELIEDVKRVAALCQKESLTGKEYEAQGRFSLSTLRNRFGSWNEVLRRAGLSVERGRFKKHCYCETDSTGTYEGGKSQNHSPSSESRNAKLK